MTGIDISREVEIASTLIEMDLRERAISAERRSLHELIDRLYLSAPLDEDEIALLDQLEKQEREVSEQRRNLHASILELRAQVPAPRNSR
jgi:hypothetical protein